jgi:hypothetical protein
MSKYIRLTSDTALIDYLKKLDTKIDGIATKGSGDIVITDPDTGVETILGTLPDGSTGLEQFVGDTTPPPVATAPYVSAQPGSFVVTWDGLFVAGAEKPRDFVHVNVIGHKMGVDGVTTLISLPVGVIRTVTESVLVTLDTAAGGESWQFSLESEDYSGNKATESARTVSIMMIDSISSTDQAWLDLNNEVAGKGRTFTQSVAPPVQERLPQNLWIDTSAGPGLYVTRYWEPTANAGAGAWVALKDKDAQTAQTTADSKTITIFSDNAPSASAQTPQTIWIDTTGGINIQKRWVTGSGWVVVADSRIASTAAAVTAADAKAQQALDNSANASSANGKNMIHYDTAPASGTANASNVAYINGDTWFQRNSVAPYNIIGQWEFLSGAWQPRKVDGAVIANIDAGTITVGYLSGQNLSATAIDGKTITGAVIQTTNTPVSGSSARGIKLTPSELMGFDGSGNKNFSLTSAGALTLIGAIKSGSTIEGASLSAGGGGIETSTSATTGVKLQNSGIKAYDGTNLTFSVDAATGIVDAPGIRTNSLTGDKIVGKSLTADKLVITSTDNLIMEADFANLGKSWGLSANCTINATAGRGSLPAMRITGTSAAVTSLNMNSTALNIKNKIAIGADSRFRGSMWVKSSASAASGAYRIVGRFYTSAVAYTDIDIAVSPALVANTWTNVDGIVPATIPAGTIAVEFYLSLTNAASGTITDIDFASVTRASDGKLIVDGAIDGKTITGATIRTAASGARIVLDQTSLNAWNTAGDNYFSMSDALGVSISSKGRGGYNIQRINLCKNPSFEVDTVGWTTSQTLARDTTQFYTGTASLRVTHTATADRVVTTRQYDSGAFTDMYLSAYVRHNSATAKTVTPRFMWTDWNLGTVFDTYVGTAVSVPPNTWTRVSVTTPGTGKPSSADSISMSITGTAFTSAETMWVDAVLFDVPPTNVSPSLGTYFDGDTARSGLISYAWDGAVGASISRERQDRNIKIKTGGNDVLEPIYGQTQFPGVGFISTDFPTLQTAGLFSDGAVVSLIEGSSDPQLSRIDVGNTLIRSWSYGDTTIATRSSINLTSTGSINLNAGSAITLTGSTVIAPNGTLNGVNMDLNFANQFTWSNSWTNFGSGYGNLQIKEVMPGIVLLQGMAKAGNKTDGVIIGVLPSALRPNRIHNLPVLIRLTNNTSDPGIISINPNGNVALYCNTMASASYATISITYFIVGP